MAIVVGYLRSPEGEAALARAVEEARLRDAELVLVHSGRNDADELRAYEAAFAELEERLSGEGLRVRSHDFVRGNTPTEDLLATADEVDAELLVIGLRRRSRVGKLVLGSNSQEILLEAACPVLAVKADDEG